MKIAQIVSSLDARNGGPSRSVRGLSDGLARCGHSVELLTLGTLAQQPSGSGNAVMHAFPRGAPGSLARSPALHHYLRSASHDLLHHHGLWQRTLHYAHVAARKAAVPFVVSPRGMMSPWAWNHRRWKKRLAALLVHPGAFAAVTGWHATCRAEADDIRRLGFTQPICVAPPNGVVPPLPEVQSEEASHWHAFIPQLAGRRVALFYSRLHAKKRVLELIDLWLEKTRGDWVLLLVGIPEQYSVNQLDAYILKNGGTGRIIVHDGAGRPPPYAVASLFLLPSHSENFGLVIAEALVRGLPVLTTDSTPWQDLATQGAGDCVAWMDYGSALDGLLNETPTALGDAGTRARTWARSSFSWENAARTLSEFYPSLIVTR
jgi:glycosyltransferase involved in cell wall biosynthesis